MAGRVATGHVTVVCIHDVSYHIWPVMCLEKARKRQFPSPTMRTRLCGAISRQRNSCCVSGLESRSSIGACACEERIRILLFHSSGGRGLSSRTECSSSPVTNGKVSLRFCVTLVRAGSAYGCRSGL